MNMDNRNAPILKVNNPRKIRLAAYKGENDFFHKTLCACSNWVSFILLGVNATL